MTCPICDATKPANCDCTSLEKRQYEEASNLEYRIERMTAGHRAASTLVGQLCACKRSNTRAYMEGLAVHMNKWLEATGQTDRIATHGDGLQVITPEDVHETSGPE